MVDFGSMKDNATEFIGDHADQAKEGVEKVGDFAGDRFGHDKVDGIEEKANDAIDNLSSSEGESSEGEQPQEEQPQG